VCQDFPVRLQKFEHCCLLVEDAGYRLLIDPGCFAGGLDALSGVTGVLVTHVHEDHLDVDRLSRVLEAHPDAQVVCDEGSAASLAKRGITGRVVHDGDRLDLGTTVDVYGREHAIIHPDLPTIPNVGYLVANRLFYAGDAFTVPDAPVEVLAVPVSAPWMKLREAVDFVRTIRPRVAVPVHDYQYVFAGMAIHLLEQLGPDETTVTLGSEAPVEFEGGTVQRPRVR
jgi:L-ascorbate metabolism protein UlaG (beta-lactamase superfamily)